MGRIRMEDLMEKDGESFVHENIPVNNRLIIITGMSGSGKSTTSQALARQLRLSGIRCRWMHEEMRRHPIREGEFQKDTLFSEAGMENNIGDMYRRWGKLVRRMLRSRSVYVMEGVLFDNILRYFYPAGTPEERISAYYAGLVEVLRPAQPLVVFLHRPNVRETLQGLFNIRGDWWRDLVLDPSEYRYAQARGLFGAEGAYTMWEDYERLSNTIYDQLACDKIRVDTSSGDWEAVLQALTARLGLACLPFQSLPVADPERYIGTYAVRLGEEVDTIQVGFDGEHLFCMGFWPYMRLLHLGKDRFEFSAFPIRVRFVQDGNGQVRAVRLSGEYDWEIVGCTLDRMGEEEQG